MNEFRKIPSDSHPPSLLLSLFMVGLCLIVLLNDAQADLDFGAKYAGEFLTLGADGRASAMGETGAAFSGSIAGAYWNPASLVDITGGGVLAMHANRFGGVVKYDFLAAAQRYSEREVFGLTILRLGVDDIPITYLENPNSPISADNMVLVEKWTSDSEMALLATYAFNWKGNWSLGLNGKILSKNVGDNSALGLGFDVGARYMPAKSFYLGARISDVTTTFLGWDTGHNELILPSLCMGAVKFFTLKKLEADLNLAFDLVIRGENRGSADQFEAGIFTGDAHFGLEYVIKKILSLRGGMDREHFTAGAGLRIKGFSVDYAYQAHEGLGESHRVSLGLLWTGNPFNR